MARRRGTELRTDFTGDDSDFRKTVERNIAGSKKFGDAWTTAAKKAGTGVDKLNKKYDSLAKKIKRDWKAENAG